jgi:hypothetical protein
MFSYKMYKTLQLFINIFTLNANIFTGIKHIKNTYIDTKVIKKYQAH